MMREEELRRCAQTIVDASQALEEGREIDLKAVEEASEKIQADYAEIKGKSRKLADIVRRTRWVADRCRAAERRAKTAA